MSKEVLTAAQRADLKVNVFRLCAQLVANDETLRAAAEADDTVTAPDPYQLRVATSSLPSDGRAPNPYTQAIQTLRASEAPPTPAPTFEERFKAERLATLKAEYARYEETKR